MNDFDDDSEIISEGRLFWELLNVNQNVTASLSKEDFDCKKCGQQLVDPVVTTCCNKYVCEKCWTDDDCPWVTNTCSICSERCEKPHPPSKFFLKLMNSRVVRCECKMEMKHEYFKDHWEKSCPRIIRCDSCSAEYRLSEDHLCVGKLRKKKEEMEKELENQKEKYEDLMRKQRNLFYDMGGHPDEEMPENIEDFRIFFGGFW